MPSLPDALLLARIQFAFTVSFHFLFPAVPIGVAVLGIRTCPINHR